MDPDTIRRNSERAQAATSRLAPLTVRKYGICDIISHPDREHPALSFTATRNPATNAQVHVPGTVTFYPTESHVRLFVGDAHSCATRDVREDQWPHALVSALDYLLADCR